MTLLSSRPVYYCALLLTALCCTVLGFNVDVKNCIKYRGPEGSMFGFSVAQHKEQGRSWLLIGAPEAQTVQPGIEKAGAVYKCGTSEDNDKCQMIPFDRRGNNISPRAAVQIDSKSHQWFGATVKSSGEDGVILACAPRYVYSTMSGNRKDPVGTCYVTKDFYNFSEYSPCRTRNWGHHRQGTCQAGLGASVSKDGERLFIGSVGSWYWQGQLYSVNSSARLPFIPVTQYIIGDIDEGQFYSQSLYSRPEVLSTNEGPAKDDDSYLGYSVAVGAFGFNSETGAAVGMPRGAELLGKVVLYSTNLTNLYNITGEQIGGYFGYSICVSDVDGDERDDIIVGAPMYSEYSKHDDSYDTGKVYVFLNKEGYQFNERNTIIGFHSKSRFGLSLAGLGDINKDGYGDFAVGAPYDGPNELGAVYIYHGTKTGVREKYSQVIKSEDVQRVSTFGFSLSGGTDLDNNQYPDLVIGAYESDSAYLMRSRPVAQITTSVYFNSENKQISLENGECTTRDGTQVSCLFLSTCLQYTGIGVDDQLTIEMQLVLDARKPKSPRMFFLSEENRNVLNHSLTLDKNVQSCKKSNVYLKNNIRDKLTPLEAELRYRISEENRKFTRTLTPVIDLDNELFGVSRDSISIQKNCGRDNICIPDLRLIATPSSESVKLGSNEKLKVDVTVRNEGEDSFETTFDMTLPTGINYVKIERLDKNEKDIPVQCSAPSEKTNNTLHCDIGNPLPRNKYVQFNVVLEPYTTTEIKSSYEFYTMVNSTNPEIFNSISDNTQSLKVPLWVETDLIIEGSSKPVDVHYNITMEENLNIIDEKQIGPQVIHLYVIRNKGPSDILEAEAYIDWPLFTLSGDPLLYLLEMPETNGPVKCEPLEEINPLKLNIDRKKKTYFESSGLFSSGSDLSVTVKGDGSSLSSNEVITRAKAFNELTEEEKKRFLEIQKKEDSKLQWADGSYEKNIRYKNSKSESTVITGGGGVSTGNNEASSTSIVNRGPTFIVDSSENGGVIQTDYGTRGSSVVDSSTYTGSSSHSSEHSSGSTSNADGHRIQGGLSSSSAVNKEENQGGKEYGSSRGVYGAAHFAETESSSGSQSFLEESSRGRVSDTSHIASTGSNIQGSFGGTVTGTSHHFETGYNTRGESSGGSSADSTTRFETGSRSRGEESSGNIAGTTYFNPGLANSNRGSSMHRESSLNVENESRYGSNLDARGSGLSITEESSTGSVSHSGSAGYDSRERFSSHHVPVVDNREQSNRNNWDNSMLTNTNSGMSGGQSISKSQDDKWAYENRGNAAAGKKWEQSGSWSSVGGAQQGRTNFSTFHEAERSHVVNTTWDEGGSPKTYVKNQWRTDDDGHVRNGSSTHVVNGLLDYRDAIHKINTGAVTNVVSSIPGDDSDLSMSLHNTVTERMGQGFKQAKVDETETVYKWRNVDGKLYKVNNVDDWNSLISKDTSTEVYEAQDYSPQDLKKRPSSEEDTRGQDVNGQFKLYKRFKRDTVTKQCGPTRCTTVKCTIGKLSKDQEVWLSFRSRAWVSTLKKVAMNRQVKLSSTIAAKITKLPNIGKPDSKLARVINHEVFTQIVPRDLVMKPDIIPLWIVVLAAVAGTAILLLLVFLLYKCGFFKRNRPSTAPEKQPLTHRNGQAEPYQTGDEAL